MSYENSSIDQIRLRLESHLKELTKNQASLSNCLSTLDELSKVPISRQLLSETHIGVFVGNLRKHESPEIRKYASQLVLDWKTAILSTSNSKNYKTKLDVSSSQTAQVTSDVMSQESTKIRTKVQKLNEKDTLSDTLITSSTHEPSPSKNSNISDRSTNYKDGEYIPFTSNSNLSDSVNSTDVKSTISSKDSTQKPFPSASSTFESKASTTDQPSNATSNIQNSTQSSESLSTHSIKPKVKTETVTSLTPVNNSHTRNNLFPSSFTGKLLSVPLRDRARHFLYTGFIEGLDESILSELNLEELNGLIERIEDAVWEVKILRGDASNMRSSASPSNSKEYTSQIKSIKWNLADRTNPHFNLNLYRRDLTPLAVAHMESKDMASNAKKLERKRQFQEGLEACQSDWERRNIEIKDGQFTCFKCKGKKTTYHQIQIRSADEPMTTFVTCITCNNRWKF